MADDRDTIIIFRQSLNVKWFVAYFSLYCVRAILCRFYTLLPKAECVGSISEAEIRSVAADLGLSEILELSNRQRPEWHTENVTRLTANWYSVFPIYSAF